MSLDGISLQIEQLVSKAGISYVEATLHFCKKYELDPDEIKEIVHPNVIEKLRSEFIQKNHIPGMKKECSLESFF